MLSIKKVFSQSIKQIVSICFLLVTFFSFSVFGQTPDVTDIRPLPLNQSIEQKVSAGQSHNYQITLRANEKFFIWFYSKNLGVTVKLFDADKKQIAESDAGYGAVDVLSYIVKKSGKYEIQISASHDEKTKVGKYTIQSWINLIVKQVNPIETKEKEQLERLNYEINLQAGQYTTVFINDDIRTSFRFNFRLYSPSGKLLLERPVKKYYNNEENLPIQIVAASSGIYQVEVSIDSKVQAELAEDDQNWSEHLLLMTRPRAITEKDKKFIAAERAFVKGVRAKTVKDLTINMNLAAKHFREAGNIYQVKWTLGVERGHLGAFLFDYIKDKKFDEAINVANRIAAINKVSNDVCTPLIYISDVLPQINASEQNFVQSINDYVQLAIIFRTLGEDFEAYGFEKYLSDLSNKLVKSGKYADAVLLFEKLKQIYRRYGSKKREAATINNIGGIYDDIGDMTKALDYYEQALSIFTSIENKTGKVVTLNNIGSIYDRLGERTKALKYYEESLNQMMYNKETVDLTLWLKYYNSIQIAANMVAEGSPYGQENLKCSSKSKSKYPVAKESSPAFAGNEFNIAVILNNIGTIYLDLNHKEKALRYYNQALTLYKGLRSGENVVKILANIGSVYRASGDTAKALEYYKQAGDIENISDNSKAAIWNNIGVTYLELNNIKEALNYFNKALASQKKENKHQDEAVTLNNIGKAYLLTGEMRKALNYLNQALVIEKSIQYRTGEAKTLSNLMILWKKEKNPHLAIIYGKQSINIYQELRQRIQELDKETQQSYLTKIQDTYQQLADLLISEGRFSEAQQVLSLLKEEEYFEYVRRDANEIKNLKERITLKAEEQKLIERYNLLADKVTAIGTEFQKLDDKKRKLLEGESLLTDQQKRYDELSSQLNDANAAFKLFLEKELAAELGKSVKKEIEIDRALQNKLRTWGDGTVALFTIAGEDRYRVILTTPTVQVDGKTEIKSSELNKKIFAFREALQNPAIDPRPLGKELYDILIKPIEKDLIAANAKTLLWSLDGTLRYIPISALSPDSKSYLIEKYQNVVITSTTRQSLMAETEKDWKALGVGVSLAQTVTDPVLPDEKISFVALPSVKTELAAIVKDEQTQNEKGLLSGKSFIDADFNRKNFSDFLTRETAQGKRKYTIVHIASHFRLGDNSANSFLLLGDGKTLTLEQISNSPEMTFENVELVTLSACNTAFGANSDSTGKEVDSLATFIELRGAKSIMATLWSVADESTSLLMSEFYRLHKDNQPMTKAEAMQKAQTAMIEGKLKSNGKQANCRSDVVSLNGTKQTAFKCNANAPFSHPYYWSPFVLIGNWR